MKPGFQTSEATGAGTAMAVVFLVAAMDTPSWQHVSMALLAVALAAWWAWCRTSLKRIVAQRPAQDPHCEPSP